MHLDTSEPWVKPIHLIFRDYNTFGRFSSRESWRWAVGLIIMDVLYNLLLSSWVSDKAFSDSLSSLYWKFQYVCRGPRLESSDVEGGRSQLSCPSGVRGPGGCLLWSDHTWARMSSHIKQLFSFRCFYNLIFGKYIIIFFKSIPICSLLDKHIYSLIPSIPPAWVNNFPISMSSFCDYPIFQYLLFLKGSFDF